MGAKDSKRSCLSYEDAVKRMSEAEVKRVCEAFKRLTGGGPLLSRQSFVQHVLGDGVPPTICEWLYAACGGAARGIALKDLVCGLVLLTKGTQEEKIKFLWTLYCNDSGTLILKNEFQAALKIEGVLGNGRPNWDRTLISLFGVGQDRVGFDHFRAWIQYNREATVLSKWLLSNPRVSLSSELETPTFYQTLAGVTHLEEQDICELEKCFWSLQGSSVSGNLDYDCVRSLVCPPIPLNACEGLFLALDVNRDGHVDFKELCCGISAACRGPTAERMKFCFKIFDIDRDLYLNESELEHMRRTLQFVAGENKLTYSTRRRRSSDKSDGGGHEKALASLATRLDEGGGLSQEEFLVWSVQDNTLVEPLLELLFQICHVSLGLRPHCRHHEYEIVMGWLEREERRGYHVGQFWYLVSSDWWQSWLSYATNTRTGSDHCSCRLSEQRTVPAEEGIVCDESLISNGTDCTSNSNEFNSNSMESVGDILRGGGDNCSIASSSGVSSSSGVGSKRNNGSPGPIENGNLVAESQFKVSTLTGEGGRLKRDTPLVQHRDFELIPDSLWKALALWYGGPLPLPRQVIRQPGSEEVELELFPLNLRILRHHPQQGMPSASWSNVVGVYGQAALTSAGLASPHPSTPRRHLAHTAAFSRLATARQAVEFLCSRLGLRAEDARLWLVRDGGTPSAVLLDDEGATLQELGVRDGDQLLLEVRNKDMSWPEEMGELAKKEAGGQVVSGLCGERRPTICLPPGATGLHNLGNTCFMNAALQAVSNTRPLTMYFQRDSGLTELNSANPLGTRGTVAKRYAELCRELWAGSTRSVAPLKLRFCLTKHAPHLGGGGQHDSQELLAWLLDALHEDLNRVAKKQYTELKDSGGRPDEVVAEEAWQQHMARDHSIITDLFYGQLKSKVTCQTCGHESVRFDPFNLLSLPLPMESYTLCEVLVIRLSGETPVKYGLRLNSEAKYEELKWELKRLCGIEPRRLLLAEMAQAQIRQVLPDSARLNPATATELFAYELPDETARRASTDEDLEPAGEETTPNESAPSARSPPEVRGGSALCMPNILCFKTRSKPAEPKPLSNGCAFAQQSRRSSGDDQPRPRGPSYLVAVHRKCVRQETYFLSQHKCRPSLFGAPLLLGCSPATTCQAMYRAVWAQVTRLLSPLPQSDQTNHATDCDDSLGYEFPFTLKAVLQGGQICAVCHWTEFCRGCPLPCTDDELLFERCKSGTQNGMCIAIDWDPTALHLRYQSCREKLWIEDESISKCRKLHTEPIDLDYCLKAFTSEERLEAKYHCSNCNDKQPATKKLQVWRLPPILIIHLKRFDYVNNKWVKTQKMVNFPFKDFDPTAYLASVPQETILRHRQLMEKCKKVEEEEEEEEEESSPGKIAEETEEGVEACGTNDASEKSNPAEAGVERRRETRKVSSAKRLDNNLNNKRRSRLESTSLLRTPIIDEHLKDFHQHKLLPGQDIFDLKYQLYAVVSHSGQLTSGHYISYACNPNGNWYCYNDSSCREVMTDPDGTVNRLTEKRSGFTPLTRRKVIKIDDGNSAAAAANPKNTPGNSNGSLNGVVVSSETTGAGSGARTIDRDRIAEGTSTAAAAAAAVGNDDKLVGNSLRCAYSEVKIPKIDTSSAYILFYERSGLDYKPYLPDVAGMTGQPVPEVELEENESELRKQMCAVQ